MQATSDHAERKGARRGSRGIQLRLHFGMTPATPTAVADRSFPNKHPASAPAARPPGLPAALLAALAQGEPVHAGQLASHLGLTRAAVWKQVQCLRKLGLGISAQPGGGYRSDAPLDLLDAAGLLAELAPATRARLGDLAVHAQLDSTSSELLRRVGSDPRDRLVCLAEVQTRGRGRRGRSWRTPLGGGIALSLLKRFDGAMASLAGLSLVAGVATADALEDCGFPGVGLKWPNDLVADGRKLGGILVELGGDALGPCHAVIGIGINSRLGAHGAAIDQPWTDLATLGGGTAPARHRVAARVLDRLVAALDTFAAQGFAAFAAAYARRDTLCGHTVRVVTAGAPQDGVARGVDARGALRVALADGERALDAGEVSIRRRA